MKKFILVILVAFVVAISSQAQGIYLRAGLGAAIGTANSLNYSYDEVGNNDMVKVTTNGYGTGLPFVLAAGFNFSENFGVELGVDYFMGFASKYYEKDDYSNYDYKTKGSMLSIVPALVGRFEVGNLSPYARLGLMIGVMNSVITTADGSSSYPEKAVAASYTTDWKMKKSGGVAIGVQAAVGSEFKMGDMFSLFGEFQLYGISYAPKKGMFKEYNENGVDQLPKMPTRYKEWKYLKEVDYNKEIPESEPNEQYKRSYHFNNVGLVIGVKINLGK